MERGDYWVEPVAHDLDEVRPESAAQLCPIRFQGQWEDAESGLYYNRFWYYEPLAGQYASPDPIGLLGWVRNSGYVNNPCTNVDFFGLSGCVSDRLRKRAEALQLARHRGDAANAARYGTTAVAEVTNKTTGETVVLVATELGPNTTTPRGLRDALSAAETLIVGRGHAEQTIIGYIADSLGEDWEIVAGGASRNVCCMCAGDLASVGLDLAGPSFRGGPNSTQQRGFRR